MLCQFIAAGRQTPARGPGGVCRFEGEPWRPYAVGQIRGNTNSMIYHPPPGLFYRRTYQSVHRFNTAAEVEAAGYRRSGR